MRPCQFDSRLPEMRRNLLRLYRRATQADIDAGLAWYPSAHRIVQEWSAHYGYHDATVACVIAAISPQCDWERNLIIADDVLAHRPVSIGGAIHANIAKAIRLRDMVAVEDAPNMMARVFAHGPKVCSFAANLAGNRDFVTVDTHAIQAALADVQATYGLRWRPYTVFACAYADVARKLDMAPCDFQAVIWHTWKRLYPRTRKLQDRRQWHVIGMED